jgi:serine/threonine-protein kinase
MKLHTKPSSSPKEGGGPFIRKLRERKIIETTAAFIGGGVVLVEFAHHILVNHYHLPHQLVDLSLISLVTAWLSVITWRWFRGGKRTRKIKWELILIPVFLVAGISLNAIQIRNAIKDEHGTIQKASWENSIAVLPFQNMSGDKEQEYFSDGLTEELINALANVEELKVVARTSVFAFKDKQKDVREIGRELNVETVLEGSVRKGENQIRITAQLINVADGFHIWSQTWDRDPQDVFVIQDEIALAIADKLKLEVKGEEKSQVLHKATENTKAHNLYLRARFYANQQTAEGFLRAIPYFEEAIAEDPNFALAYADLANTFVVLPVTGVMATSEAVARAKQLALKSLKLDDELAEAHTALANIKITEYDWEGGLRQFERAINLNPGYSHALQLYGYNLMCLGKFDKAERALRKAFALDPFAFNIPRTLGRSFYFSGQYDKAAEILNEIVTMNPQFSFVQMSLAQVYLAMSKNKEALEAINREKTIHKTWNPAFESISGIVFQRMGESDKAQQILGELIKRSNQEYASPYWLGALSIAVGETDQGFFWLEKAHKDKDFWMRELKVEPLFSGVREDPRFESILSKLGLD